MQGSIFHEQGNLGKRLKVFEFSKLHGKPAAGERIDEEGGACWTGPLDKCQQPLTT